MGKTPGPNDYNLVTVKGDDGLPTQVLEPGLGRDEPDSVEKDAMRSKSHAAFERMKNEIALQTEELSEREKAAEKKEHENAVRELRLKTRETALATAEKELQEAIAAAQKTGPAPSAGVTGDPDVTLL